MFGGTYLMDYTTYYHLPQWAPEDRVLRQDFIDAFLRLDKQAVNEGFVAAALEHKKQCGENR